MNPLLAQFVEEAAELLGAVDSGLLALEQEPTNQEILNEIFRAAHTLKGSSGLFDIAPLTSLTHAAEDVLDSVRAGELLVTSELVDAIMAAFDLVGVWIAELSTSSELPDGAQETAAPTITALRALLGTEAAPVAEAHLPVRPLVAEELPLWAVDLPGRSEGGVALRYSPAADCFFRGEDPLYLVRQLPGLRHLSIARVGDWPAIGDLDEYDCTLVLSAVASCAVAEVEALFRYVPDEIEIVPLPTPTLIAWHGRDVTLAVLESAHLLLSCQRAALASLTGSGLSAGFEAVVTVVRGVLAGAGVAAHEVEEAYVQCQEAASSAPLLEVVVTLIDDLNAVLEASSPTAELPGSPDDLSLDHLEASTNTEISARTSASHLLKVDQTKIDQIMELVGELVVAKNALPFLARAAENDYGVPALARLLKDQYGVLDRLTGELQASVMDVRRVPLSIAFWSFPRLVRDVGRKLGKEVRLITEGDDTLADKDVVETLGDPLTHLVRNSLDHGLEPSSERGNSGKSRQSTLTLAARQDGDSIVVEVRDDGRGINPARLRAKVVERGLVEPERVAAMSDDEAVNLIFLAGLSTANEVSDLSGRGVGMDAVRDVIERLGGSIVVESVVGDGTLVRLRVPLSMAVSRVMIIGVGGQRFGVPVDIVQETVRVPASSVQRLKDSEAIVLRDRLVPLVSLQRELGAPEPREDGDRAVLVVRVNGEPLGLTVDRFHEDLDVIVKPLQGIVAGCLRFTGTAMLGDGDILLILNAKELLHAA